MDCKGKHFSVSSQYLGIILNLHFGSNYQPESNRFYFAYRLKQKRPPITLIDGRSVHMILPLRSHAHEAGCPQCSMSSDMVFIMQVAAINGNSCYY